MPSTLGSSIDHEDNIHWYSNKLLPDFNFSNSFDLKLRTLIKIINYFSCESVGYNFFLFISLYTLFWRRFSLLLVYKHNNYVFFDTLLFLLTFFKPTPVLKLFTKRLKYLILLKFYLIKILLFVVCFYLFLCFYRF